MGIEVYGPKIERKASTIVLLPRDTVDALEQSPDALTAMEVVDIKLRAAVAMGQEACGAQCEVPGNGLSCSPVDIRGTVSKFGISIRTECPRTDCPDTGLTVATEQLRQCFTAIPTKENIF